MTINFFKSIYIYENIFYICTISREAIKHHPHNQATHDRNHHIAIVLLLSRIIGPNGLIFLAGTNGIVAKIQFEGT